MTADFPTLRLASSYVVLLLTFKFFLLSHHVLRFQLSHGSLAKRTDKQWFSHVSQQTALELDSILSSGGHDKQREKPPPPQLTVHISVMCVLKSNGAGPTGAIG